MATPTSNFGATPLAGGMAAGLREPSTPLEMKHARLRAEHDHRNRDLTDEELDAMLPPTGYEIVAPPAAYQAIRTPARKLTETPAPMGADGSSATPMYVMPAEVSKDAYGIDLRDSNMPDIKHATSPPTDD